MPNLKNILVTGLAHELYKEIAKISVVDTHEHLPLEKERCSQKIDIMSLFSHYCRSDLEAAGLLQGPEQEFCFDSSKPLMERWKKAKPYLDAIRYGSYAYPAFAYVRDILQLDDINENSIETISERLQKDNKKGIYKKLIQEVCNIEYCIQSKADGVENDQAFFRYLCQDQAANIRSREDILAFEKISDFSIYKLEDYVKALSAFIANQKQAGAIGLKIGVAYNRSLEFPEVSLSEAAKIFIKLRATVSGAISSEESEILGNYLIRREIEACIDNELPIAIHTGYQAGNRNDIRNARAIHLWSLLSSYPKARFDLFHGSFPYVEDMVVLGKYFENVSLNMCWMHIMSPEISKRALSEWLDTVPVTKIFAFGGDYLVPEKIYGHLQLARTNVATVLADKITQGRMMENDALKTARLLFHENPKRWYKLEKGMLK